MARPAWSIAFQVAVAIIRCPLLVLRGKSSDQDRRRAARLPSCRRRDARCRLTIFLNSLAAAPARAACFMSMTLAPILISRASFATNFLRSHALLLSPAESGLTALLT